MKFITTVVFSLIVTTFMFTTFMFTTSSLLFADDSISFEIHTNDRDKNDIQSSNDIGIMQKNGKSVIVSYDNALGLYKKSCEDGDSLDCIQFARLYQQVCTSNPKKFCSKYE